MIEYVKGDLFAKEHLFIAHGVNCQGVMGSGVAKIIKEKYPWAYTAYKDFCELRDPEYLLGATKSCWQDNTTIIHCFTQFNYGKDGKRYVSYDAVDDCMKNIARAFTWKGVMGPDRPITEYYLAMPKIGAGLGGGHWPIIEEIINYRLKDIQVKVYEL